MCCWLCAWFLSFFCYAPKRPSPFTYTYLPHKVWTIDFLPLVLSQMGKKIGPPMNPTTHLREKFLSLMQCNLFMCVNEMHVKNITITVSVRVRVMVGVSLGWFVSSNNLVALSVAISWPCVHTVSNRWLVMTMRMRTVNNTLYAIIDRACARSATPTFFTQSH